DLRQPLGAGSGWTVRNIHRGLRHVPHPEDAAARVIEMREYLVVGLVVLAGMVIVTSAMGVRRLLAPVDPTPGKLTTYESGVDPVGSGWAQGSVRYLVYALLYVIFAVDAVYLFPWALVIRTELGVASLVEMAIFIGVLVVALLHVWRRGLLRWW
ncbi:NADH-quinone oxidoreductase subunit A, partial [Ornithinimicrobium sp.]|uniref:NADH-quinone oxidoreductase subunit A n=1 Tax=Ornithinimicrobium sp. TaxID=1977084 RepID=UPI0034CE6924